ncbi:MAG: T9SS type A sorting domain-containing protein [Ignavibacteria bacterium]|nr:T9SS type A sorting domain-containing protein [Ignavibacteria bacterium]
MKRALLLFFVLFLSTEISSQRILVQSNFETIPLVFPDSIPAGWKKLDVDQNNPVLGWAVNDTNQHFGGDTAIFKPRAHSGNKSLFIFWLAGSGNNNLNDDWVWTDSLRIETGDSLNFWCLLGSTPLIAAYADSVQVHICSAQNPSSSLLKLATIKSNDSSGIPLNNNIWREFKYNLSQFAGQRVYIAWRYYMIVNQTSGLWINIDDLFIGNRSAIGITPVNTEIPKEFSLDQNYPNPFNPTTKIRFEIPASGNGPEENIELLVYDMLGREVTTLVNENLRPGTYEVNWDAGLLPSGTYFYRLVTDKFSITKKMILVK